jgi:hypothetical protein
MERCKKIDLPTRPWQQITTGFVDMPKTKNAHGKETMDQVLVVVDQFSKQVILAPIRNNFITKEVLISRPEHGRTMDGLD